MTLDIRLQVLCGLYSERWYHGAREVRSRLPARTCVRLSVGDFRPRITVEGRVFLCFFLMSGGISGNSRALGRFSHEVKQLWHYWLKRRSRAAKEGERLWRLLEERFRLPPARLVRKTDPQRQWSLPT